MRGLIVGGAALAVALVTTPAAADPSPEMCRKIAASGAGTTDMMNTLVLAIADADATPVVRASTGKLREAAVAHEAARAKLVPLLREYVATLEDFNYQLKVCGRR